MNRKKDHVLDNNIDRYKINATQRNINLDLIRCVAVFLVFSVHFFWNSGFYNVPVEGIKMYVMTVIRTISIDCVPLFIVITGYLMSKKTLTKRYYIGLIRILIIFFICTMFMFAYRHFFQKMELNAFNMLKDLLGDAHYSWYVGMYMGLFCMIPFLNLSYNGLDSRNKKRTLILTCFVFTSLPSVVNYHFRIMPDFFTGVYPFTYYFIGAYIRDYQEDLKSKKITAILFYCLIILINSSVNVIISYNQNFVWTKMVDYGGIQNVLSTTALFIFLSSINLGSTDSFFARTIAKISKLSFGMYLLSWIMDQIVYHRLNEPIPVIQERFKFYIVAVPVVFIGSMILSAVANGIYKLFLLGIRKVKNKTYKSE